MDSRAIARVLAEIAETAAETLELQEVFNRVAAPLRTLVPFDHMGVVRILDGDRAVLHATTLDCGTSAVECTDPTPLESWSPRLRPRPGPIARVDDAAVELDRSYPCDAMMLDGGLRSGMWEPFRAGGAFPGGVWLSSDRPGAFTDEHQEILMPVAAVLGAAVEHWRIWDAERRQRERLDRLDRLVAGPLADSLDVRAVFERISQAVQPVLPHDALVLLELDAEGALRLTAVAGETSAPTPSDPVRLTPEDKLRLTGMAFDIVRDIPADLEPTTDRARALLATGMRSWFRVQLRLSGEVRGSIGFLHREPGRYSEEDVEVGRRVADRIALAQAHSRIAERTRLETEARERAERLEAAVETLTQELASRTRGRIVGTSGSWKHVLGQIGRVARSDTTVLITGESGTGKEVVASLVHEGSPRRGKPFVAINCAALPEQLLESELFGHEKGAFTGAVATKVGRIEQAAGGTLFLDEIAELHPMLQAKLLRVLQEREFQRVGGTRTLRADVRVVAATNRDLRALLERGQFRDDLYYRLNVFEIGVPPLRERPEDILALAGMFLEDLGRTMGRPAAGISKDARDWLLTYTWPGNVRELRNAIERAILLCDGGLIAREHLPAAVVETPTAAETGDGSGDRAAGPLPPTGIDLSEVDRAYVERALRQAGGNKSRAARLLGLTRSQLYSRLDKYGLG